MLNITEPITNNINKIYISKINDDLINFTLKTKL